MELDACIKGRRSVRKYADRSVPKEITEKLLDAGVAAPSGMNAQPWRFVVIEKREVINKLSRRTKELLLGMQWPDNLMEFFKSETSGSPSMVTRATPLMSGISAYSSWKASVED